MLPLLDVERWESGLELRVRGEVVEEGDAERRERSGEKAVRRRRRELEVERTGVKEAEKRLTRVVGATIFAVVYEVMVCSGRIIECLVQLPGGNWIDVCVFVCLCIDSECDCSISPHGGKVRS
jgi:hypothetical protein